MTDQSTTTTSDLTFSNQSMRTSSFAMSDFSDLPSSKPEEGKQEQEENQQNLESIRIRKAYSRPLPRSKWRTSDNCSGTENVDYFDETDFRNTDR